MKINRILLDLDDVCCRFTMAALAYVGCPVDPMSYEGYDPEWGYDIVASANKLSPGANWNQSRFWGSFNRQFWSGLVPTDEFSDLLARAESLVGVGGVCFLTTPIEDPDCAASKVEWVYSNTPSRFHRQFIITPQKHFCARPDALLIDDSDANVKEFAKWGGNTILVPRPWNENHGADTVAHVNTILDRVVPPGATVYARKEVSLRPGTRLK